MRAHHSYEALDLALRMDVEDAAWLLTRDQDPQMPKRISVIDPLHLEAARIVCEWVDMFGVAPSVH